MTPCISSQPIGSLLCLAVGVIACPGTMAGAPGVFSGTVLTEDGQPVSRAEILLSGVEKNFANRVTTSDQSGKFSFEGLAPGLYKYEWSHPRFERARVSPKSLRPDRPFSVEADKEAIVQIQLRAYGVISGTVTYDDGEAAEHVEVFAEAADRERGPAEPFYEAKTDDRGAFRITGVRQGTYRIMVHRSSEYRDRAVVYTKLEEMALPLYRYYPDASRADDAELLEVRSGVESNIAPMQLRRQPAADVNGTLALAGSSPTQASLQLRIKPRTFQSHLGSQLSRTVSILSDGRFRIPSLPSGSYRLEVSGKVGNRVVRGTHEIVVRGSGVATAAINAVIVPRAVIHVKADSTLELPPDISLTLSPGGDLDTTLKLEHVDPTHFAAASLYAGSYTLQCSSRTRNTCAVSAVMMDGQSVSADEFEVALQSGGSEVQLEIEVSSKAAELSIQIDHFDDVEDQSFTIWMAKRGRQGVKVWKRDVVPDSRGRFRLSNMPPGIYEFYLLGDQRLCRIDALGECAGTEVTLRADGKMEILTLELSKRRTK